MTEFCGFIRFSISALFLCPAVITESESETSSRGREPENPSKL
jgi:hypothetical protein